MMLGSAGKADDPAQQRVVATVRRRGILGGEQFVEPVGGKRQYDLRDGDPDVHETRCRSSNHQTGDALDSATEVVDALRHDICAWKVLPRPRQAEVMCRHPDRWYSNGDAAAAVCFNGAGAVTVSLR